MGGKDRKKGEAEYKRICKTDEKWSKLQDIPIPPQYIWIFKHFMQIWQDCEYDMMGNIIFTPRTVNDYVECFKVPFTVEDKKCLFKMKRWALNIIASFKDKEN